MQFLFGRGTLAVVCAPGHHYDLRSLAKRLLIGTRFESPAKRAHFALTRNKSSLYDAQTIAIMGRVLSADSNAIDIGAFEGGMLRHIRRLAPGGSHIAFEPTPEKCQGLLRRFPDVEVFPYALGAVPSTATYHCMLRHPALSGLSRRMRDLPAEPVREIQVQVETLDRIVPSDRPISFIKVDVEGAELGVFRGGIQTLRRNRPVVVFEFGLGGADYFGADPGAIYDLLVNEIGLRLSLLGEWLSRKAALSRDEFVGQFEDRVNYYFVAHP